MHPTAARTNRTTLQATIPPAPASPLLSQHQVLYSPIANPVVHYQPCATGLHPPCVYSGVQHNSAVLNPTPNHMQGKNARWQSKNKIARNQQQQISYSPKPIILYDQGANAAPAAPQPTASFLVASSTFAHGSFPNDQYNTPGIGLIPQSYYKPQDVQTFCLQSPQQQEQPVHGPYYNIAAANTCSVQAINTNTGLQLSNLGSYAGVTGHQTPGAVQAGQSNQIFTTSPVNLAFSNSQQKEKPSALDVSTFKYTKNKMPAIAQNVSITRSDNYAEWPVPTTPSTSTLFDVKGSIGNVVTDTSEADLQKTASGASTKTQEEHYSDESSASFDFTIEAEKMVSALCTSSNDLEREEIRNNKKTAEPLFSGAGDTASSKTDWFEDFCSDYGNAKSIAVQTESLQKDRTQYPELIRKVAYWGCTEAEIILNNSLKADQKSSWLKQLLSVTKTATAKSSTCFPIFAGDRVFVSDLITVLLRIMNSWLILDNYLNKQHYPSLSDKFDDDLVQHFNAWEENTYEVLNRIVHTFKKLDENSESWTVEEKINDTSTSSFPGKSLYTNLDLFDPIAYASTLRNQDSTIKTSVADTTQLPSQQLFTGNVRNIRGYENEQRQQQTSCSKEAKLRSKWTVTENPIPTSDSPKSVPNMFLGLDEGGQASCRFRAKGNASTLKLDTSTRSLNAEFFHLRSKVLESNHDLSKQWAYKEKKSDAIENKLPPITTENECLFKPQRFTQGSCENPYTQKYFPRIEASYVNPSPVSLESVYFTSTADAATSMGQNYAVSYTPYSMTDYSIKYYKNFEQCYESRAPAVDPMYIGKPSIKQLELATVPKNKMTLLSQIEPCTPEKASEEMTANLSAWFASMRSPDSVEQVTIPNIVEAKPVETVLPRLPPRQELSKNAMELARQLQMDTNRQLQTLQNMQSIQSAPWTALNLINNCTQVQHQNDDYDSSEDVRVYMKPGSYNVPKKKHQRKSNRRMDSTASRNQLTTHRNHYTNKEKSYGGAAASSTPMPRSSSSLNASDSTTIKFPFPATPIVPPPTFSLENSPRILKRSDSASKNSQDVTWKAACASAEILLDALNVKGDVDNTEDPGQENVEAGNSNKKKDGAKNTPINSIESQAKSNEKAADSLKRNNECDGASSYEASGDDSESPYRLSPNTSLADISQSPDNRNGFGKTNVKTDSWLIRTLNSVSIISKQKRRKKSNEQSSSESTNSSANEDDQVISASSLITSDPTTIFTQAENTDKTKCSKDGLRVPSLMNDHSLTEDVDRIVGKATYSETVRRSLPLGSLHAGKKEACKKSKLNSSPTVCSTVIPIPGRKSQRKDPERSFYLLQKSRKSYSKKSVKSSEAILSQNEEGSCSKIRLSRSETTKSSSSIIPYTTTKSAVGVKSYGKKKESTGGYGESIDSRWPGKTSDRGWSVWYSSKRKQTLSPLALSKLEIIHQTVWKMEEARVFKYPTGSLDADKESIAGNALEKYCKIVKRPLFLETVGYKLKNRVYHKVEHVVRDFRRIVHNSKLYHKNDRDRVKIIETLSKKLEELFEEHFASWNFDNISASPREEGSPLSYERKSSDQKPVAGHNRNAKKNLSTSVVTNDTTC